MEPPTRMTHTVESDAVERDCCEQHIQPQTHTADPNQWKHEAVDESERVKAKIEQWKTHGHPKHPIWQFFSHEHSEHEQHKSSPHLKTTVRESKDVVCELCGAHVHAEHQLRKGEEVPEEELKLARSILHGMWDHLAKDCELCTDDVRHQMMTWRQLPKETRAAPPAAVIQEADEDTEETGRPSSGRRASEENVTGVGLAAPSPGVAGLSMP